jgi:hypothetical protein
MIEVDATEAVATFKAVRNIGVSIDTDAHMSDLMDASMKIMKQDFQQYVDMLAMNMPSRFHHVYEWGQIGNPAAALWETLATGRGRDRAVTFEFRPSVTVVPIPDVPPSKSGKQLQEIHVFTWKAPVMEYGEAVHIAARNSNVLAFPNPDLESDRPLIFTRSPVVVRNPGGTAVQGAFTTTFSDWWGGPLAEASLSDGLLEQWDDRFNESFTRELAQGLRRGKTTSKTAMVTNNALAASIGHNISKQVMRDLKRYYDRRANG